MQIGSWGHLDDWAQNIVIHSGETERRAGSVNQLTKYHNRTGRGRSGS